MIYSVVQWFENGVYEYVRRNVEAEEAIKAFKHYITCVGARLGTTVRVMITDAGDSCVFEWKREEGIIWPEGFNGAFKLGSDSHDSLQK